MSARAIAIMSVHYFALVFFAGFVFGVIRTLLLTPRFGEQTSQLIEAPLLLLAIVLAASFITRKAKARSFDLAIVGAVAAALVLCADLLVGTGLRHLSIRDVIFGREIITGTVYYVLVAAFAALPCVLAGRWR